MKLFHTAAIACLASGPLGFSILKGEDSPTASASIPNVRAAVQRSLPYIERVGTTWMAEKKCNSCHVVTFQIWSHNEALAHGLEVDRKKLADWVQWSLADSLADRHSFRLRPQSMMNLKAAGMSDALLAKLKTLKSGNFMTQEEFLAAVEKALGKEDLEKHKEELIHEGLLPRNGGGPDTLAQLLLGRASLNEGKTGRDYDSIRSLLLEWQEYEGSWQAGGQLPELKWGRNEANDATTLWSVLALDAAGPADKINDRSRHRMSPSLKNPEPGITLQSLVLHLIIAHKFGEPARAETLLKKLIELQRSDGGWSWVSENPASDAFATGQALHALGLVGRDGSDPCVRRAWEYLLRTQGPEGAWDVPLEAASKRKLKLNIYNFWGTAWAAIGMLNTLPASDNNQRATPGPPAADRE